MEFVDFLFGAGLVLDEDLAFAKIDDSIHSEMQAFFETKAKTFKSGVDDYTVFATMKSCDPAPWYEQESGLKFRESDKFRRFTS